jgi:adenylylsulfate kinase
MLDHPGFVLWLTGLPSSGKSTLARRVRDALCERSIATLVLDGDEVRAALRPTPGYDDLAREDFYRSLANLAAMAAAQQLVVLVPATAQRRAFRQYAREQCAEGAFAELYVKTPLALCAARDAKGLYRQSAAGAVHTLPGVGSSYEAPEHPALVVEPDETDAHARVAQWLSERVAQRAR